MFISSNFQPRKLQQKSFISLVPIVALMTFDASCISEGTSSENLTKNQVKSDTTYGRNVRLLSCKLRS